MDLPTKLSKKTEQYGAFVADFFVNTKSDPPLYHYILTRTGEREIVHWGQEISEEEAHSAAMALARCEAKKAG